MRVLQINATVNSGSTGRIAEDIGLVLINVGHESYIAYGRGNQPSNSNKIKIGNQWDVNWHGVVSLLLDRHGFASRKATKQLINKIEELKPDVINLHNIHGYYVNIEILFDYLKKINIPVVWTFHDCWPFTGHCTHFDSVGCEKWKTQCEKCPKTKLYPKSIELDNSFKNYNDKKQIFNQLDNLHIITPSNWLKSLVKQSFLSKFPVSCIHNGIDLSKFSPVENVEKLIQKWNLKDKIIVLGVANVWQLSKGLSDFVKLAEVLSDAYQVVLIGLTKKQIAQLPKNIIGIERTESIEELAEYYSLAKVFVNPTYQDNFPTTNIEALACGTPVVTYNTGGSPEAIDKETGIVVEKGNVNDLKTAIERVTSAKTEYYDKEKCRQRAEKHFDKNDRYQDYLQLFKTLVKES
ncbi:glycosyltransferase family 4 protein [Flavobacterium haoranii]|uniref:Glycosyltransferase involved in cell wall bisynthesis n=1 Tax=Flavobacterium haoranii TaxID=683124 RepID=A0A1M6CK42_9FLAO|nr:glycosyltransferase family 4 protein [Flavobacterium haoranii]SHI61078.1 Glycosyltransferase involved in cell wall bisynthesis [Flavobacterium haoranii]